MSDKKTELLLATLVAESTKRALACLRLQRYGDAVRAIIVADEVALTLLAHLKGDTDAGPPPQPRRSARAEHQHK